LLVLFTITLNAAVTQQVLYNRIQGVSLTGRRVDLQVARTSVCQTGQRDLEGRPAPFAVSEAGLPESNFRLV